MLLLSRELRKSGEVERGQRSPEHRGAGGPHLHAPRHIDLLVGRDRREFDFTLCPKVLLTFWSVNCLSFFLLFIRSSPYVHVVVHTDAQLIHTHTN